VVIHLRVQCYLKNHLLQDNLPNYKEMEMAICVITGS
jgi:hypothetical protein